MGGRRGPRHRVGHGVEHRADDVLGRVGVEAFIGARGGKPADPVLVVGGERTHPPARVGAGRLDLPGRDQPQPEQRRAREQPDAGVQVVAACALVSSGSAARIGSATVRRSSVNSTTPSRGGWAARNDAVPVRGTKLTCRN